MSERIESGLRPESLAITTDFNGSKNHPSEPITQAAEAGFDAVMWCHEWDSDYEYSRGEVKEFSKILKSRGIKLLDIHASKGQEKFWLAADANSHRAGIELVRNRIRMAGQLDADTVVLHVPSEADARFSWGQFRSAVDSLMPTLEEEGVSLAFENLYQETTADGFHPENTSTLKEIFNMYDTPNIGMCLDSGHWNVSGHDYSPDSKINQFRDRIMALHLHDNDGNDDDHRIPFTGTVNWDSLMEFLANSSYSIRPLNFESSLKTHRDQGMTVDGFLKLMRLTGTHLAGVRDEQIKRDAEGLVTGK